MFTLNLGMDNIKFNFVYGMRDGSTFISFLY